MQESGEMYLETLLILEKKNGAVRSVEIGDYMGFSKPSVSRAVKLLKEEGMITADDAGLLRLTAEGRARAEKIYERHTLLTNMLLNLGVDGETAREDACRMEHYISESTFDALKAHSRMHGTNPTGSASADKP